MDRELRRLLLVGATGEIRTAQFDGREHVVVPMVVLIGDSVIRVSNAPGPELVPAAVVAASAPGWNGEPVVMDHPALADGTPLTANDPKVLEAWSFGRLFNSKFEDNLLQVEAWLDPVRAAQVGPDAERVIERARAGEMVEVSVGAFVDAPARQGMHEGQPYVGVWMDILPDHLATLPEHKVGACSVEMGCGAPRTAYLVTAAGLRPVAAAAGLNDNERRELLHEALSGAESGFKWLFVEAVYEAQVVYSLSDDNGNDQLYERNYEMEGEAVSVAAERRVVERVVTYEVSAAAAQKGAAMERGKPGLLERIAAMLRIRSGQGEEDLSDMDLRDGIDRALRAEEPGYLGIEAVFPNKNEVVYAVAPEDDLVLVLRTYAVDADGAVALTGGRQEVKPEVTFVPVAAAECGCPETGEERMKKDERIKALIACEHTPFTEADAELLAAASDEQLTSYEDHGKKLAEAPAPTAPVVEPDPAAPAAPITEPKGEEDGEDEEGLEAKPLTEEEYLAQPEIPDSIREMVARHKATDAKRQAELLAALTDAQAEYTEEELKAMDVPQLERLARMAKAVVPEPDYTGNGVPRVAADADAIPKPPSLTERYRAAQSAQ